MTGGWRKLHNLYSSRCILRMIKYGRMRWAGHVARMEEKRNAYWLLAGDPKGKRPLARTRSRWVDNIKIGFREVGDRLCCLVVRVLGYRSGGPGSIPGTTKKKQSSGSGTGSTQPREYN
jgi:hypothetical protein